MLKQTHKIATEDLRIRFFMFKQILVNLQILLSQESTLVRNCVIWFDSVIGFQKADLGVSVISFESLRFDMRIRPDMLDNQQLSTGLVQELLLLIGKIFRIVFKYA